MPNEPEIVDKCEPLPCFKRNNYFYGKLLTVSDFQVEQQYFVNKLRLINRLIHGAGIVCGLKVLIRGAEAPDLSEGSVRITEGVALDFCGREIVVPENVDVDVAAAVKQKYPEFKGPEDFYVWIKYDSCGEEKVPKVLEASTCQEECCYSRIKEAYKVDVDKSVPKPWATSEGDVCAKWDEFVKDSTKYEFFLKDCLDCLEEAVIVLAKITVSTKNGSMVVKVVNNAVDVEANQRRLVYSNDRLYSLIECLRKRIEDLKKKIEKDLPKIIKISWGHNDSYNSIETWEQLMKTGFKITFSKPMKQATINSNTLSLTLEETVPRKRISRKEMPVQIRFAGIDKVTSVEFSPDTEASDYEEFFSAKSLRKKERPFKLRLIIQLRGDFVYTGDEERKCLDGNFLRGELGETGSGNGCEGGLFESWVTLALESNRVPTYAYLYVYPNPVGVGQRVVATFWVTPPPPRGTDVFHNFRIKITKPDGMMENIGPLNSNPDGSQWYAFNPSVVGSFDIKFEYPGETFTSSGEYYMPCSTSLSSMTPPTPLIVQEEPVLMPGGELYASPRLMIAMKAENASESRLLKNMKKAEIKSVADLAELAPAEIEEKLGVSNRIALELSACAKSAKEFGKIEIDNNLTKGLIAAGTMSVKALAESKPENIASVLRITRDEAETLRKKAMDSIR